MPCRSYMGGIYSSIKKKEIAGKGEGTSSWVRNIPCWFSHKSNYLVTSKVSKFQLQGINLSLIGSSAKQHFTQGMTAKEEMFRSLKIV